MFKCLGFGGLCWELYNQGAFEECMKADIRALLGKTHMGGCQNYGPFLGTLNIRCRIIIGIQKWTIIFTTTHMNISRNRGGMKTYDFLQRAGQIP